ncbi:MAG: hypothetical protein HY909_13480 [Deltaproteobacteria bacterium]|nr:hypothetical protein [Deltaproteobacteria bacterium]
MSRSALGVAVLLSLAACTGAAYDGGGVTDADAPSGPPRVTGVLFVERVQTLPHGDVGTDAVQVGARFLRVVGVGEEALPDLVGMPRMPRALGCHVDAPQGAPLLDPAEATVSEVRLLDVGALEVRSGERALMLSPRRFPDLWSVVSGVTYGADGALPLGRLRFSAAGDRASGVGPFEVEAQAPEPLSGVTVGELALPAPEGAALELPRRGRLSVRWARPTTAQPDPERDRVAIVFEGAGVVVCGARDEGVFDVDAATTERLRELLRGGGSVRVHRLRTRAFTAPGLDAGALVFDLSVAGRVR